MSNGKPIWLTEQDVVGLMDLSEAIGALELGLLEAKTDRAVNMGKTHAVWDNGNTLHAIGAVFPALGYFGTKTWGHTHGGATPLFLLWEAESGRLEAIIEAFALGQMRTGGISGVATRWMAPVDADELAVIGTGKQALAQVAAVALVRPIKRVRVYSPNPDNRARFAAKLAAAGFDFQVSVADSVEKATAGAPIVTTVTRAREAFLDASMLVPGTHINAVGAITPERRELSASVVEGHGLVAADDVAAASRLAAEFMGAEGTPVAKLTPLYELVGEPCRRTDASRFSIFKAMGMGLSDLSLAVEIFRRARAQGAGRVFDHPVRAAPRLGSAISRKEVIA